MQVGHACLEAGRCFQPEEGCHLIVVSVPDRARLELAVQRLAANGVRYAPFYEPDDDLGFTATCTEPLNHEQRRCLRHYPLWTTANTTSSTRGPPHTGDQL